MNFYTYYFQTIFGREPDFMITVTIQFKAEISLKEGDKKQIDFNLQFIAGKRELSLLEVFRATAFVLS